MNPALPKCIMVMFRNVTGLTKNKGWGRNNKSKIQGGRAG